MHSRFGSWYGRAEGLWGLELIHIFERLNFCQASALTPFCTVPTLCSCRISTSARYQVWFLWKHSTWKLVKYTQQVLAVAWPRQVSHQGIHHVQASQPGQLTQHHSRSRPIFPLICQRCNLLLSLVHIQSHFRAVSWIYTGFTFLWLSAPAAFSISWVHQKSPAFSDSFAMKLRWVDGQTDGQTKAGRKIWGVFPKRPITRPNYSRPLTSPPM